VLDCSEQIDSCTITEQEQGNSYVANLTLYTLSIWRFLRVGVGLLRGNPSQFGQQLSSFARDRHGKILWIVELVPVAFCDELPQPSTKYLKSVAIALAAHRKNTVSACHSS
jgi:hypothetical protein